MKRSEINAIMRSTNEFIRQHGFYLPPFAYWSPVDWAIKGDEVREIVESAWVGILLTLARGISNTSVWSCSPSATDAQRTEKL